MRLGLYFSKMYFGWRFGGFLCGREWLVCRGEVVVVVEEGRGS